MHFDHGFGEPMDDKSEEGGIFSGVTKLLGKSPTKPEIQDPERAAAIRHIESFKGHQKYYDDRSAAIARLLPDDPGKASTATLLQLTRDENFLRAYRNNQWRLITA